MFPAKRRPGAGVVAALVVCLSCGVLMAQNPARSGRPPVGPSPVIRHVEFAPLQSVVLKAIGSDNWPITWADDDAMYTSYGDGWGFEPHIKQKLSQGISKVLGGPEDFQGVNIRAATIERTGGGANGAKASGMLAIDGVLYMWVRNTNNSTMTWSTDYGKTWEWGFRFTESFGCPTLLNFGKNYAGARDEYVYTYSQDGPTAYHPYDGVVMARVPKDRIRDQEAYEFFVRLDDAGRPVWSRDIAQRGHVLHYPKNCERLDVVYNAGLKRYIMTMSYARGKGGWGIYDAPEPWGPWTVAFHTTDWGLGDIHGFRLPSKWISPDGKTMWLIFSGRTHSSGDWDAFCLRKLELTLHE